VKPHCTSPAINEKLLLFLDGRLDAREREAVNHHVQGCFQCTDELRRLREIDTALKALPSVPAEAHAGACLNPDIMVDLSEGGHGLSQIEIEHARRHLAACTSCRNEYQLLLDLTADLAARPPLQKNLNAHVDFLSYAAHTYASLRWQHVLRSAIQKIAQRFADWFAEFPGLSLQPQPVLVRNGRQQRQSTLKVMRDMTRGVGMRVEIEECGGTTVDIIVFLYQTRKALPLKDVRVSIYCKTRELVSLFVKDGRASFRSLPQGTYELAILRRGEEIKRVRFSTN